MGARAISRAVPSPLPEKIGTLLQESRWLGVGAVALFLIMALWGFSKEDPGWSHAVGSLTVHNPAGRAGAWIATFEAGRSQTPIQVLVEREVKLAVTGVNFTLTARADRIEIAGGLAHVIDFKTGAALFIDKLVLDQSLVSCDSDGVLDNGESGVFSVTVRNGGSKDLQNGTLTISLQLNSTPLTAAITSASQASTQAVSAGFVAGDTVFRPNGSSSPASVVLASGASSGGLAWVDVADAPSGQSARAQNTNGFMPVFVVRGGINMGDNRDEQ